MAGLLDFLRPQAQTPGMASMSPFRDPSVLLPMAAALMGNQGNTANFANAFGTLGGTLGQRKKQNQTLEYFRKTAPEYAAMIEQGGLPAAEAWESYLKGRTAQTPSTTDDMREYMMAKQQGFEGSFMDYMVKMKEAGRNQVNIDTGAKLPSGFRWLDPKNQELGVEPIPGGPGEQMPSELAARIGLAQDALKRLDAVEHAAGSGKMTGPIDWATGQLGRGEQGELGRELAAGAEALTRMLTGAGMNMAEVQREVQMYLPAIQDDAPTLANKVSQLKRRLASTIEMAGRGRGVGAAAPAQANDGWQDLGNGVRIRQVK